MLLAAGLVVGVLGAAGLVSAPPAGATTTVTTFSSLQAAFFIGGTYALGTTITAPAGTDLLVYTGKSVTLNLEGYQLSVTSPTTSSPALRVPPTSSLTIEATGGGELYATGGADAAGIGGYEAERSGSVTIDGGTVIATGGIRGAGIGGGDDAAGGTTTINGGTVTATGGTGAAGIGGGSYKDGGSVTIGAGAHVTAAANDGASAVGDGATATATIWSFSNSGTLVVPQGGDLVFPAGMAAANTGTIDDHGSISGTGTVDNFGTIVDAASPAGTVSGTLTVDDDDYLLDFAVPPGSVTPPALRVYAEDVTASGQTLPSPTLPAGDTFEGWSYDGTPVTNGTNLDGLAGTGPATLPLVAEYAGPVILYVRKGSSGNGACTTPAIGPATTDACATITDAYDAATTADPELGVIITVGPGTYPAPAAELFGTSFTSLTVQGAGPSETTIDGGTAARDLWIGGGTVTISSLAVDTGRATRGAGVLVAGGNVTLADDTFSGDDAVGDGGAIYASGTLTATDDLIANDTSTEDGGAIYALGDLTVLDDTFSGDDANGNGGAVDIGTTSSGTLVDDTFTDDSAPAGAGGAVLVTGGLGSTSTRLAYDTFSNDTASTGGAVASSAGTVTLSASIADGSTCDVVAAGSLTGDHDVSTDSTCAVGTGSLDVVAETLTLDLAAALAANGATGPETTLALEPTSPAIDFVPVADCTVTVNGTAITTTERGDPRPGDATQTSCDAGAYELQHTHAVLQQDGTTSGSATAGRTATFELSVSNPVATTGLVSYTVTNAPPGVAMTMAVSGLLEIPSTLAAGSYTLSGTDADPLHDSGTWSFSLEVETSSAPGPQPHRSTPPRTAPTAPRDLSAAASTSGISLTWEPPTTGAATVTGYEVFSSTSPVTFAEAPTALVSPDTTAYTDTQVSAGTRYFYEVVAVDAVGASPPSNEASAVFGTPPTKKTTLSAGRLMTQTPTGKGYWLVTPKGKVTAYGDARPYGTLAEKQPASPVVAMAATRTGRGYWLAAADGAVYAFGEAKHPSAARRDLTSRVVAICADPASGGYWLATADGTVVGVGAPALGTLAKGGPSSPITSMAATQTGKGYWLATTKGSISAFGNAKSHGSLPESATTSPVVAIAADPATGGYWLLTENAFVLGFTAPGSEHTPARRGASGLVVTATGVGYVVVTATGASTATEKE